MIKVTLKDGVVFNAKPEKSAFYKSIGAKVEIIQTNNIVEPAPEKRGRKTKQK